jgi:hypothetical protein
MVLVILVVLSLLTLTVEAITNQFFSFPFFSVMKRTWLNLLEIAQPSLKSTTFKCKRPREARRLFLHR